MSVEFPSDKSEPRGVDTDYQHYLAAGTLSDMAKWIDEQRQQNSRGIDLASYYLSMPYVPGVADPHNQATAASSLQTFVSIEVLKRYMELFSDIMSNATNSELIFYPTVPYPLLHTNASEITQRFGARASDEMQAGMRQAEQIFLDNIASPVRPLIPYKLDLAKKITRLSPSNTSQVGYFETIIPHVYVKYEYPANQTTPQRSVTVFRR